MLRRKFPTNKLFSSRIIGEFCGAAALKNHSCFLSFVLTSNLRTCSSAPSALPLQEHDHTKQATLSIDEIIQHQEIISPTTTTATTHDDQNLPASSSSASSSSSLSILQIYTSRGKTRPHPLKLLTSIAEDEIKKSLLLQQQSQSQSSSEKLSLQGNNNNIMTGDNAKKKWSIEEIQIITADAARKIARASKNIASNDDDRDLPGAVGSSSENNSNTNSNNQLSFDHDTLIETSISRGSTVDDATNILAQEQERFDELHSKLFSSRLLDEWVDTWEMQQQEQQKQLEDSNSNISIKDVLKEKSIDSSFAELFLDSMNENDGKTTTKSASSIHENSDVISTPVLATSEFIKQNEESSSNNRKIVVSSASSTSSCLMNQQLSSVITLLQRHILLASLVHRFDAAVQAFMLLAQIRQNIDTVRDEHDPSSPVDIEVLSWRNLRDVANSCAKDGQYETAETLVRFVIKKIVQASSTAKKISSDANRDQKLWSAISEFNVKSHLESLVTDEVMTSLAKCIKRAKDLKRFREFMAIEGGSSTATTEGGALSHISVSTPLYNELILACSRCNDEPRRSEFALMFHRTLLDQGLEITPQTYASLIAVYASDAMTTEAFSMFHEAKSHFSEAEVAACPALYNRLIESYTNSGKLHDAIATANLLMENGAPLTRRGFHCAMICCAVQGDYGQAQSFLRVMQGGGGNSNNNVGVRTTLGVGEKEGIIRTSNDLIYSATNPSKFYSIPPTPTSLAIQMASLFFIRKSKEMNWKEKMTVIGDLTSDAFSLLPFNAKEEEDDAEKRESSMKRIALFCENEPFFCSILGKVLCENIVAPSIFENYGRTVIVPDKQKQLIVANDDDRDENPKNSSKDKMSLQEEKSLYRRHLNLPVRILQSHVQRTLTELLERAFDRYQTTIDNLRNEARDNNYEDEEEIDKAEKEFEVLEEVLANAHSLFAPQRPTRMPRHAEVAALMPDVILNPSASVFTSSSSSSSTGLLSSNSASSSSASGEGETLVHLLQTILPKTTFFILPFASLRAIVAEFDALHTMADFPLLQREVFDRQLRRSTSYLVAENEERNKISTIEARMKNALGNSNNNKNGKWKIRSSDIDAIIMNSSQSSANNLLSSSSSPSSARQNLDDNENADDNSSLVSQSSSSSSTSSLSNPMMSDDERRSLTFHEKELRLDRLSDAVLALAVFLRQHRERVHIGSVTEELDLSRCASSLHLSFEDPVQRAAAAAVALLFSPLDCSSSSSSSRVEISNTSTNTQSDIRRVIESAKQHRHFGQSAKSMTSTTPIVRHFLKTKTKKNLRSLYFDSRINLSLVTCDRQLFGKFGKNTSFVETLRNLQSFARAVGENEDRELNQEMLLSEEEEEEFLFSSSTKNNKRLRTNLGRKLLPSMNDKKRMSSERVMEKTIATRKKELGLKSFVVRVVDPTKQY